jgi:hypothetical protein
VVAGDQANDARFMRQRRGKVRAAWAIQRHQRAVERAATCIRPESLVTTALQAAIRITACSSWVSPARLRHQACCSVLSVARISLPASWSFAEPNRTVAFVDQLFRQLRIVIVRPAFCRAELRQGRSRSSGVQTKGQTRCRSGIFHRR